MLRKSRSPVRRALPRLLLILLAALFLSGTLTAWAQRGEEGRTRAFELTASNLEELERQQVTGVIDEPEITARAAVLMEAATGGPPAPHGLHHQDHDRRGHPGERFPG